MATYMGLTLSCGCISSVRTFRGMSWQLHARQIVELWYRMVERIGGGSPAQQEFVFSECTNVGALATEIGATPNTSSSVSAVIRNVQHGH
jgi:hypothetical protein